MKIDDHFDGPERKRHCTDILFLLLLISCTLCMIFVGCAAVGLIDSPYINKGNPARLLNGVDYMGNICGSGGVISSLKQKWTPSFTGTNPDSQGNFVPSGFSICVSSCPAAGETRSDPYGSYGEWTARVGTVNVLNYCTTVDDNSYIGDIALSFFGDFYRALTVISIVGFILAAVFSLLFLSIIRFPMVLRTLVWTSIVLVFGVLAAGSFLLLERANYGGGVLSRATGTMTGVTATENEVEIKLSTAGGAFLGASALLWLCVICFMRDRIALAIGLVRESSKALTAMPLLTFFPILQFILFIAITAVWSVFFFYLASSGEVKVQNSASALGGSYKKIVYNDNSQHAILFMVFGWLWNIAFLEAYGQLISAHAVLVWYFAETRSGLGSGQVIRSAFIVTRYHMGTAAFGSLILAIIRTVRVLLEYVKYKLSTKTNCIAKYILCCLSCCLWCFDKCIKFLNKHAYIQCALFGTGFCRSAKNAFVLIVRNVGRVAAITVVGDFVVLIGKISISLSCAAVGYLYMSLYMENELRGVVLPTALILFIAFSTSTLFLGVVSATADTVLQAYITDEQHTRGKINRGHENSIGLTNAIEEQRKLKGPHDDDDVREFENEKQKKNEIQNGPVQIYELESGLSVGSPFATTGTAPQQQQQQQQQQTLPWTPPLPPMTQKQRAAQHLLDVRRRSQGRSHSARPPPTSQSPIYTPVHSSANHSSLNLLSVSRI